MKSKLIFFCSFVLMASAVFAQAPANDDENSCFLQYSRVFESRGANIVENGTYDNVIISVRQGSRNDCYKGKVIVEKNAVITMYLKFTDGQYELFDPVFKFKQDAAITNGISKTLVTTDDKLINVLFVNHIKPKKKSYEKAPLPSIDDL